MLKEVVRMILRKSNKKSKISPKEIKDLDDKSIRLVAIMIAKIRKLKAKRDNIITNKIYYKSGFICCIIISLFIFIQLKGNTDILNNWIKINDENVVSFVYPKSSYSSDTSKLIYKDFESIEKDFDIEFFKPYNLFIDFDLDVIEVSFDGTQDRIRINALYTNSDNHNITYNAYIVKKSSTNSKVIKEKKNTEAKELYCNGIKFLVFQNNRWYSVSWYYQDIEYEIHGFKNEQEILNTIKNIEIEKR